VSEVLDVVAEIRSNRAGINEGVFMDVFFRCVISNKSVTQNGGRFEKLDIRVKA